MKNKIKSDINVSPEHILKLINERLDDKIIQMYLKIVSLDKLHLYPTIINRLYMHIKHGISDVEWLTTYSDEQFAYVTNLDSTASTKTIACPGSGKTRSIIGRIKFMVDNGLADANEIYATTFSANGASHIILKMVNMFPDCTSWFKLNHLSTIDSLAKSILCRLKTHKSTNVEILSIAFRNYLDSATASDIELVRKIKPIGHLFVDEAQDLNDVQYTMICLIASKLGAKIHLVGDPNQNIYQFRSADSKYIIEYDGIPFNFTKNYRSTQQIINFVEHLKQIPTLPTVSATGKIGSKVILYNKPSTILHKLIIDFIINYAKTGDISDIAIISPTKGTGTYNTVGLSVFFNLFKLHKIKFNQMYDEAGLSEKKSRKRIPDHVNLLTWHGTKGLEFKIVFVMDFYHFLFNIEPSKAEHQANLNLLYVACSRAIEEMYVCVYSNTHDGYYNHWLTRVNPAHYIPYGNVTIPKLNFREEIQICIHGITEILAEMKDVDIDAIHDLLDINESTCYYTRRMYQSFIGINRHNNEALFGILCEELYYLQHNLFKNISPRRLKFIEQLIGSELIIINDESEYKHLKRLINKSENKTLDWDIYQANKKLLSNVTRSEIEKFDTKLSNCLIVSSEFINIINNNLDDISETYKHYLDTESYNWDYKNILYDFFYLILVIYAYDINHYYYVTDHGLDKRDLLESGMELYECMNKYITTRYYCKTIRPKIIVKYDKMRLCGEIDLIESYDNGAEIIVEIKCVKELSIKYYIQLILYNFCYYYQKKNISAMYKNNFKIINLLTGLEHYIIISTNPKSMFKILLHMTNASGLGFQNMNLIYDLETTNLIKKIGPVDYMPPKIPRSIIYKVKNKWHMTIYPEILEIAIVDYDTHMIIMNTLVKPTGCFNNKITKITGITQSMIANSPNFDMLYKALNNILSKFTKSKLIAHNGSKFDWPVLKFYKLINTDSFTSIDTMSLIPLHIANGDKLQSKKLSHIYKKIIGKNIKGHRALVDVIMLVEIMEHLRISF